MVCKNTMVMEEQETDIELASESIPVPQVQEPQLDPIKRPRRSNRSNQPRTRKKLLYASIRKLMEFYFSDANLSKDRYLATLIQENPCEYSFLFYIYVLKFI